MLPALAALLAGLLAALLLLVGPVLLSALLTGLIVLVAALLLLVALLVLVFLPARILVLRILVHWVFSCCQPGFIGLRISGTVLLRFENRDFKSWTGGWLVERQPAGRP